MEGERLLQVFERTVEFAQLAISRNRLGFATNTSWPNSSSRRLTHGECVPTSTTTRLRSTPPNRRRNPASVVRRRPSSTTYPLPSTPHHRLFRSPRSTPTVSAGVP